MIFTNLIQGNLNTQFIGQHIEYYPFTDSTNEDIWELVEDNEAKNFTLNNKDFKKLNTHIKNNPQDLYALTEDINYLSKWTDYMSEFKRQELLLNLYNSFDPLILNSYIKPKNL